MKRRRGVKNRFEKISWEARLLRTISRHSSFGLQVSPRRSKEERREQNTSGRMLKICKLSLMINALSIYVV